MKKDDIIKYLHLIDKKRFNSFHDLFKMVCLIYSIIEDKNEVIDILFELSKESKYSKDDIIKMLNKVNKKTYSLGTLFYYCNTDNKVETIKLNKLLNVQLNKQQENKRMKYNDNYDSEFLEDV
jgi:site-specific DNA-adenine methylase